MTYKENAAFVALAALIFLAFSPVDQLAGKIVAIGGFVICSGVAIYLYCKPEPPPKWPGDR